jgi:hypothetical protein
VKVQYFAGQAAFSQDLTLVTTGDNALFQCPFFFYPQAIKPARQSILDKKPPSDIKQ